MCGPKTLSAAELLTPWLEARGGRRLRIPVPGVGALAAWNLLRPAEGIGEGASWRQWLAGRPAGDVRDANR